MANINGTNLAAPVVPFTTDDTYPTHLAQYGKGGHRSVQTLTDRDNIFTSLRDVGMTVYVIDNETTYTLKGGILNSNWVEGNSGAIGSDTQIPFNNDGVMSGDSGLTFNSTTQTLSGGRTLYARNTNLFIDFAGNTFVTGTYNVGIGNGALQGVNTGTINTAIGTNALKALTSGNGNVAIGDESLTSTNGSLNFACGYEAGKLVTGSGNLLLGAYAANTETTFSNKLVIESSQTRNANKDYLVTGDFNQRWIRFDGAVTKRVYDITSPGAITSGTATAGDISSVRDTTRSFTVNEFQGKFIVITSGMGAGQVRQVANNTSIAIYVVKNFTIAPDGTSNYKLIEGISLLGENLNSEYYFDLNNDDFVINLPTISSNYYGAECGFTVKVNSNNNKLYFLTSSTDLINPDNTQQKEVSTLYQRNLLECNPTGWIYSKRSIETLQLIKQSTKDLVIDLYSKIYKITVPAPTTVTFNIDSTYLPILRWNSFTIELDIDMVTVSAITWPGNVTWVGGSAPTFGSIAKYRLVFRTEDAGLTWLGNLAYTY